jgi:hypothetical protein
MNCMKLKRDTITLKKNLNIAVKNLSMKNTSTMNSKESSSISKKSMRDSKGILTTRSTNCMNSKKGITTLKTNIHAATKDRIKLLTGKISIIILKESFMKSKKSIMLLWSLMNTAMKNLNMRNTKPMILKKDIIMFKENLNIAERI